MTRDYSKLTARGRWNRRRRARRLRQWRMKCIFNIHLWRGMTIILHPFNPDVQHRFCLTAAAYSDS